MTIKYAILGLLSWKPFTGYELKKVISDSAVMYWSGNNNQIYRTLIQLLEEGLVTNEVQYQENSPVKKIYSITEKGLAELKNWVLAVPEFPEFKNTFLIQLAWADQLKSSELEAVLARYEQEIRMQLIMLREKGRRGSNVPHRTPRETYLWETISANIISSYENEENWVKMLRRELQEKYQGADDMNYWIMEENNRRYIECIPDKKIITNEHDALDLIAICGEYDTNRLMLHSSNLPEVFFNLKTGFAGEILQKFVNYHLKTAMIMPLGEINEGRFKEMVTEANKGNHFRVFGDHKQAVEWLVLN